MEVSTERQLELISRTAVETRLVESRRQKIAEKNESFAAEDIEVEALEHDRNTDLLQDIDGTKVPRILNTIISPIDNELEKSIITNVSIKTGNDSGSDFLNCKETLFAPSVATTVADVSKDRSTVSLDMLLQIVVKEDWLRVYEMTKGYEIATETHSSAPRTDIILCALNCLSRLKLGDPAEIVYSDIKCVVGALQHVNMDDVTLQQQSNMVAIIYFVCAIAEAAVGDIPLTACKNAQMFLKMVPTLSSIQVPDSWVEEAKKILSVEKAGKVKVSKRAISSAADEWKKIVAAMDPPKKFDSFSQLMEMTGVEAVKQTFIAEYQKIQLSQEQGLDKAGSSYNARCDGNPGTGKTTVAKIYANFLVEMEILPKNSVVITTSGSTLLSGGLPELKKHLSVVKAAGGGVIFIDETYQLCPQEDREGRQILDYILVHSERMQGEFGNLVWILAGYNNRMDKLFEHNPGLPSRFPIRFLFEDFSDEQLLNIFLEILKSGGVVNPPSAPSGISNSQKKDVAKQKTISMRINSYSTPKPDDVDEWGNKWHWDPNNYTWYDDYNNISGYGVSGLGYNANPVISRNDNEAWLYVGQSKLWQTQDGLKTSETYPGKNAEIDRARSKKPLKPFILSDEKWARIAIRRVGCLRGTSGFGNARAIRILFDDARRKQAMRIMKIRDEGFSPDIMRLERDDLLGPFADESALSACTALQTLRAMEGLDEVKQEVEKLLRMVLQNAQRENAEKPLLKISLNRVFLGNPGNFC